MKTAEKLRVDPKKCIAIEDAVNGVESAKNARMFVIALLTSSHKEEEFTKADKIIKSLKELEELI